VGIQLLQRVQGENTDRKWTGQQYLQCRGFGPLQEDEVHMQRVVDIVRNIVNQFLGWNPSTHGMFEHHNFILLALVPEAVVTAIEEVNGLIRANSEELHLRGVHWTDEEVESFVI